MFYCFSNRSVVSNINDNILPLRNNLCFIEPQYFKFQLNPDFSINFRKTNIQKLSKDTS